MNDPQCEYTQESVDPLLKPVIIWILIFGHFWTHPIFNLTLSTTSALHGRHKIIDSSPKTVMSFNKKMKRRIVKVGTKFVTSKLTMQKNFCKIKRMNPQSNPMFFQSN